MEVGPEIIGTQRVGIWDNKRNVDLVVVKVN